MTLKERLSKLVEMIIEKLNILKSSMPNASYSETEQLTGGTWINGKPMYRKVITGSVTDKTILLLIDSDVEEICLHNGTADLGRFTSRIVALPKYEVTILKFDENKLSQMQIFYEFEGTSRPTHIRVNSSTLNSANTAEGYQVFNLNTTFKITIDYTKVGGVDPEPEVTDEWIDADEWIDEEEWIEL